MAYRVTVEIKGEIEKPKIRPHVVGIVTSHADRSLIGTPAMLCNGIGHEIVMYLGREPLTCGGWDNQSSVPELSIRPLEPGERVVIEG